MDLFRLSERAMAMDGAAWDRHASPWSFWTRFSCLPLIALAIWSRVWIGWWALAPLALALVWTFANPRVFPQPKSLESWPAQGVIGERIFLSRRDDVAPRHRRAAAVLTAVSGAGFVVMAVGLWALDLTATLVGMVGSMLAKAWFVDRMAWVAADWRAAGRAWPWEDA